MTPLDGRSVVMVYCAVVYATVTFTRVELNKFEVETCKLYPLAPSTELHWNVGRLFGSTERSAGAVSVGALIAMRKE